MTNPPSLHRYLYAFQNPTIFVDPNGRIAFLKWIQEKLEGGGTENAAEAAELIQDELGGVAGAAAGGVLGVAGAAADATAGLVGLLKASKRAPDAPPLVKKGGEAQPKYCFVAGTLVLAGQGLRPIEEIDVGDVVWARNEETGETRLQEVVQLFQTPDQVVYDVEVEAEDGRVETFGMTAEHPFRVEGKGWVGAAHLQPGDEIVTNRDGWLRVRQVRGSPERQTVFNFEVSIDHTYFVGTTEAWVHNLCEQGKAKLAALREKKAARLRGNISHENPTVVSSIHL